MDGDGGGGEEKMISRWRLICISTVISLSLVEAGLRIFYPQKTVAEIKKSALRCFEVSNVMPFGYKPNCAGQIGKAAVRINSMGLRNRELEAGGKKRMLLVGDSFVFGSGVEEDERVGDIIAKIGSMEVISAGFWGGAGPDTSYVYLRYFGLELKPDVMGIVIFPFNDIEDLMQTNWEEDETGIKSVQRDDISIKDGFLTGSSFTDRLENPVFDRSHLWGLIRSSQVGEAQIKDKAARKIKRWLKKPAPTHGEILRTCLYGLKCYGSWAEAVEKFRRMVKITVDLSEKEKIKVVFFIIPASDQVFGSDPEWSAFRHVLNEEGVRYLDFFEALKDSGYSKDELYFSDGHWTALGHKIAAETAVKWFKVNNLQLGDSGRW